MKYSPTFSGSRVSRDTDGSETQNGKKRHRQLDTVGQQYEDSLSKLESELAQ